MSIRKIPYESTWELRHQVMWPDKPFDFVKLPEDEKGMHFGLFVDEHLVSIVSAFVTDEEAQFRKFATLSKEQGRGYGTRLLKFLFNELENLGARKIWCNARIDKTELYERFGMIKTDRKYEKGGICFVIMEKCLIH